VVEAALAQLPVQEPKPKQIVAQLFAEEPFAGRRKFFSVKCFSILN
jgi:hypothetical protein